MIFLIIKGNLVVISISKCGFYEDERIFSRVFLQKFFKKNNPFCYVIEG